MGLRADGYGLFGGKEGRQATEYARSKDSEENRGVVAMGDQERMGNEEK